MYEWRYVSSRSQESISTKIIASFAFFFCRNLSTEPVQCVTIVASVEAECGSRNGIHCARANVSWANAQITIHESDMHSR